MSTRVPDWVKILMLKGEKGDRPTITTTPIDNGTEITFAYSDGTSVSVDVHNATSGDYLGLTNKPQINGNLISGNKTGEDLGLVDLADIQTFGFVKHSDIVSVNVYKYINVPGNSILDGAIPIPEEYTFADYTVIGIPQLKGSVIISSWNVVPAIDPEKPDQLYLSFEMYNPTSTAIYAYIDAIVVFLKKSE